MFTLTIETDNAAFGPTAFDRAEELARLLRIMAKRVEDHATAELDGKLHDLNGNACGTYTLPAFDHAAHAYPDDEDAPSVDAADITEIACTYGRGTPSTCYVWQDRDFLFWYAVNGSLNVNRTDDQPHDGVDVETLADIDTGTASAPINSAEDMARFCSDL